MGGLGSVTRGELAPRALCVWGGGGGVEGEGCRVVDEGKVGRDCRR
jgi:hypothetical protein